MKRSSPLANLYHPFVRAGRALVDLVAPADDVAQLMRIAVDEIDRCVAAAERSQDPTSLRRLYSDCSFAENALTLAVQEARRRKLIPRYAADDHRTLVLTIRRQRSELLRRLEFCPQ